MSVVYTTTEVFVQKTYVVVSSIKSIGNANALTFPRSLELSHNWVSSSEKIGDEAHLALSSPPQSGYFHELFTISWDFHHSLALLNLITVQDILRT